MPISVVCPGCKARFSVNDKFAGKQGPCPKCKQTIKIPEISAESVTIHAPEEFAGGGKDAKGKLVGKPIAHEDLKFQWAPTLIMATAAVAAVALAFVIRFASPGNLTLGGAGLVLISAPLCAGLYAALRDTEKPPHRGMSLWVRSAIVAATYVALWGFVAAGNAWFPQWTFLVVPLLSLGAIAAFAAYELDFGTAAIHFGFYLAITLALRWIVALPPVWTTIELPFMT